MAFRVILALQPPRSAVSFDCTGSESVLSVKRRAAQRFPLLGPIPRLYFRGEEVFDSDSLEELGIAAGATLTDYAGRPGRVRLLQRAGSLFSPPSNDEDPSMPTTPLSAVHTSFTTPPRPSTLPLTADSAPRQQRLLITGNSASPARRLWLDRRASEAIVPQRTSSVDFAGGGVRSVSPPLSRASTDSGPAVDSGSPPASAPAPVSFTPLQLEYQIPGRARQPLVDVDPRTPLGELIQRIGQREDEARTRAAFCLVFSRRSLLFRGNLARTLETPLSAFRLRDADVLYVHYLPLSLKEESFTACLGADAIFRESPFWQPLTAQTPLASGVFLSALHGAYLELQRGLYPTEAFVRAVGERFDYPPGIFALRHLLEGEMLNFERQVVAETLFQLARGVAPESFHGDVVLRNTPLVMAALFDDITSAALTAALDENESDDDEAGLGEEECARGRGHVRVRKLAPQAIRTPSQGAAALPRIQSPSRGGQWPLHAHSNATPSAAKKSAVGGGVAQEELLLPTPFTLGRFVEISLCDALPDSSFTSPKEPEAPQPLACDT